MLLDLFFPSLSLPLSPSNFDRSSFVSWGLERVDINPQESSEETLVQSFSGRGHLHEK